MNYCFRKTALIILIIVVCGCATSEEFIRPGTDLSKYKRIAVLPFVDYPYQPGSGVLLADIVSMELLKQGINVIDRSMTSKILNELSLGSTGIIDESTAPRIGQLLGVSALLTGSINKYNTSFTNIQVVQGEPPAYMPSSAVSLSLKLIDVETGQIVWAASAEDSEIGNLVEAKAARNAVRNAIKKLIKHL